MTNGIGKIDLSTIFDAALMAGVGAVLAAAVALLGNGFDLFTADWIQIGKEMANVAFAAGVLSIAKDFVSTDSGKVLNLGTPYKS